MLKRTKSSSITKVICRVIVPKSTVCVKPVTYIQENTLAIFKCRLATSI